MSEAGARECGHLASVRAVIAAHWPGCAFRRAATCAAGVECAHGHDVCPDCDRCTCPPNSGARPVEGR